VQLSGETAEFMEGNFYMLTCSHIEEEIEEDNEQEEEVL
jgi:hypothetical protein